MALMATHLRALIVAAGSVFVTLAACDNNNNDYFQGRAGAPGPSASSGSSGTTAAESEAAETLFRAIEGQLTTTCGGANGMCHVNGSYPGSPPRFLAGPDAYVTIKGFNGIVVKDPETSILPNHGQHAGPAVVEGTDFRKAMLAWLDAEASILLEQKLPTTAPFSIVSGANDIDISAATSSGPTAIGAHLKFSASLIGGILSLSSMQLSVPAGTAAHLVKPRFIRITGTTETPDPADSFSTIDQVFPDGTATTIPPGAALFGGAGWTPYVFATDKLRIELEKLEPGTVATTSTVTKCKNPTKFGTDVLPTMRTTMAANGTCQSCHGNGLAPNIGGADVASICIEILGRLDQTNFANSKMITHVTMAGHTGGLVANPTAWKALLMNNQADFF